MANKITEHGGVTEDLTNARTVRNGQSYEHKLRGPVSHEEPDGAEEEEVETSAGNSSSSSETSTEKRPEQTPSESPSTAQSTDGPSNEDPKDSSTVSSAATRSTGRRRR